MDFFETGFLKEHGHLLAATAVMADGNDILGAIQLFEASRYLTHRHEFGPFLRPMLHSDPVAVACR